MFSQKNTSSDKDKKLIVEIKTETKNHIRKGNKLYNEGLYAEAENQYKSAIALNPNYDKSNFNYGNTQFLQNKIKEAKKQYELVSKTTKDKYIKADSHHNIGNIAMKEKQYAQAVDAYKNSLRKNPNDDETRYNLALAQKLLKEEQQKDKNKKDDKKDNKDKDKNKYKDNKDKNKDQKNEKEKDKKNEKGDDDKKKEGENDKDKKDKQDKKDDGKGKNDQDKKEQQQPKPQPSKLSPDQVKQLLEAMNNEENKTQKKMNAKKERGRKVKQDKDW
jgi:tetratricopeptide (TPR) repeat protein